MKCLRNTPLSNNHDYFKNNSISYIGKAYKVNAISYIGKSHTDLMLLLQYTENNNNLEYLYSKALTLQIRSHYCGVCNIIWHDKPHR